RHLLRRSPDRQLRSARRGAGVAHVSRACPGGSTGTSRARRSACSWGGAARRARVPPVDYLDKPYRPSPEPEQKRSLLPAAGASIPDIVGPMTCHPCLRTPVTHVSGLNTKPWHPRVPRATRIVKPRETGVFRELEYDELGDARPKAWHDGVGWRRL